MNTTTINPYKKSDALDKKYKFLILKWLSNLFKYENYPHSFKDQWIVWNIWNGELTISFNSRQEEHNKLITLIPKQFMGIPQYKTLKIVNENTFYLRLERLLDINYPNIVKNTLINTTKHPSTEKGWNIIGEYFYTYDWEVFLDDSTSILYHNQKNKMDMIKGDYIYNSIIQERAFINYLNNNINLPQHNDADNFFNPNHNHFITNNI